MSFSPRIVIAIAWIATAPLAAVAGDVSPTEAMPAFRCDPHWLKLPGDVALGEVSAVAVDRRDHLWVLHRPRTAEATDGRHVALPIVEFDAAGRYMRSFGGAADGYEWPEVEHSLAVTARGDVWIGGNFRGRDGHGDDMLLKFDATGRFVMQIGRRDAGRGNLDTSNLRAPADIAMDDRTHELFVADGYGNQRVIVFDERSGEFLRMWGAFGAAPPASNDALASTSGPTDSSEALGSGTFNGVHAVEISRDGHLYVSDRANQRIQVFTPAGKFLRQVFVDRGLPSPLTVSGITFSADPAQRLLYVADWGNSTLVVIDRRAMKVVGTLGRPGTADCEFRGPHLLDHDSKGAIYVAEVQGRRVQKLMPSH